MKLSRAPAHEGLADLAATHWIQAGCSAGGKQGDFWIGVVGKNRVRLKQESDGIYGPDLCPCGKMGLAA